LSRFIIHADTTALGAQPEFHPPQQQQAPAASVATANPLPSLAPKLSQSDRTQVTLLTQDVKALEQKIDVLKERHGQEIKAMTVQAKNAEARAKAAEAQAKAAEGRVDNLETKVNQLKMLIAQLLPQQPLTNSASVAPPADPHTNTGNTNLPSPGLFSSVSRNP
jgi:seryl-tRNA synthetase